MAASLSFTQITDAEVSRSADQVFTDLQGETVVLNVKTGKYYNLNAMGARIWELIEQPRTAGAIVQAVLDEYDVERERCEKDVSALLDSMRGAGLVNISISPGTQE